AIQSIRDARQNLAARKTGLANMIEQQKKFAHLFEAHDAYLNRAANDLLSTYRSANMHARTTPAPAHFNATYSLAKSALPASALHAGDAHADVNIETADATLKNAINQVNQKFEEAVGSFHKIGEFTSGGGRAEPTASA
ncbi:MAG TPA: hypothetical protein VFR09_07200, partial [Alphaproteobacteria bacterium]|nr:hypothetical protein [Alphaproteobacteria bacterium]